MPTPHDDSPPGPDALDPLTECIDDFEGLGSVSFAIGEAEEQVLFERFMEYIRTMNAPTQTDIDEAAGIITVSRRFRGAVDGLFF